MKPSIMKSILALLYCIINFNSFGQSGVTIGSNVAPDNSALLDLTSTTKGLLPPRMSSTQRVSISSPAAGLIVFDTDKSQLYLFDGSGWQPLVGGSSTHSIYAPQIAAPTTEQQSGAYLGMEVDIYNNYAVAGVPRIDTGATLKTGAVYVYKKNTTGAWTRVAKLYASDFQANANFGASVAIHGNYIVVGAPLHDVGAFSDAGKIYVFVKGSGDTWTEQTNFTKQGTIASYDYFGFSVDVSSTTTSGPSIIASSPYADLGGSNKGAVFTYRYNGINWVYLQTLAPIDLAVNDYFGWVVAIDGDYCSVGAPYQDNSTFSYVDAGAVYIFVSGGGVWTQQQKLPGLAASSNMGYSLTLQQDKIAIGSPFATPYSNTTSQVIVYMRTGATWSILNSIYLYQNQGFDITNRFGISASLDGDRLLISMPAGNLTHTNSSGSYYKSGYVLVYKLIGTNYYLQNSILDNDVFSPAFNNNYFGNSISSKNGNYIIGIPGKQVLNLINAGTVAFGFIE